MSYSTCCGAHTTMPEMGICPDCLEHCDWEDEDEEETPQEELERLNDETFIKFECKRYSLYLFLQNQL